MTRPRTPPREPQIERDTAISVPRQAGPAGASYSPSASAGGPGRWIYVSGQLPFDGDGRRVERPLGDQAGACFDRVAGVLAKEGATLADVARITAYLTSLDDYDDYSRVRGERFPGNLPASAAVGVAGLIGGALVEIDAIAFIADR